MTISDDIPYILALTLAIDDERSTAFQGRYDFLVDPKNSRKLTDDEQEEKADIEQFFIGTDDEHNQHRKDGQ
jgi:hypothetical protein